MNLAVTLGARALSLWACSSLSTLASEAPASGIEFVSRDVEFISYTSFFFFRQNFILVPRHIKCYVPELMTDERKHKRILVLMTIIRISVLHNYFQWACRETYRYISFQRGS
jgi:hypothetical protein